MESKKGAEEMGIHASNRFAQGGRKRNLDPKGTKKSGTIFQMNRDTEMRVSETITLSQPKSSRKKGFKLLFFLFH